MKQIKTTRLRVNQSKKTANLLIDSLNLGNNFTYNHFIKAIKERSEEDEKLHEIIEELAFIDCDFTLKTTANGNYSVVEDTFCIDEFFDIFENN